MSVAVVVAAVGVVVSVLGSELASTGVCFVQVPKTASESFADWLGVPKNNHTQASRLNLKACWSFAIARNPWDRLRSWYLFCRKGYHGVYGLLPRPRPSCGLARRLDFSPWLEEVLTSPEHEVIDSVARWILDENGRQVVDYVGQFENLQEVADTVANRVPGLRSLATLKHLNRGGEAVLCLSAAADSLIRQRFAYEIKRFSYNPVPTVIVEVGSATPRFAMEHRLDLSCSATAGLRPVAANAWADFQHRLSASMSVAGELPRSLVITVFVHSRFGRWWLSSRNLALWPTPARGPEGEAFLLALWRSFEEPLPADQECLLGRWAAWLLVHELSVEAGVNLIGKHGVLPSDTTQDFSSPLASLLWPPSSSVSGSRSPLAALAADAVDESGSALARSKSTPSCTPQKAHAPPWETVGASSWRIFALLARISRTVGWAGYTNISLQAAVAKYQRTRVRSFMARCIVASADRLRLQLRPWWQSYVRSKNVTIEAQRLFAVQAAESDVRQFAETFQGPARAIAAVFALDAHTGLFAGIDGVLLRMSGR